MKKFINEKLLTSNFWVLIIYLFLIFVSEWITQCIIGLPKIIGHDSVGRTLAYLLGPVLGVTVGAVIFRAALLGIAWIVDTIVDKLKSK